MKKLLTLFLLLIILLPASIGAGDFGLLINQNAGFGNSAGDTAFEYSATALPRFSFLAGDAGSVFISAGLTFEYINNEAVFIPELMRTELSMLFGAVGVRAGRIGYSTPMPMLADGLFDGFQITHTSKAGKLGIGAWYTGLLCKKTPNITMTGEDAAIHGMPIDYSNFTDTYFASKRLLVSADWEHPSVLEMFSLKTSLTGQFDLNNYDVKYDSQYLTLKIGIPANSFSFELGGSLAMSQSDPKVENTADIALAGELGIICTLPGSFSSRLAFNMIYSSGRIGGSIDTFIPITSKKYGTVFQSKITGLTVLSLDYSARVTESLGLSLTALYFIRNNLMEYDTYPIKDTGKDGNLLGGEFSGRFVWSPFSDLQLILGGGAFIPAMGNNWQNSNPIWKANLTVSLSI
ncbi:MAG: hypothetical protein LBU88_09055 [Treponema sp.]|jgi:hypothetical protein|nr:hypothetical protein [Treponema sp.]